MNANRNVDPELEEIRKSVEKPPNTEDLLNDLSGKFANIHASFLFTPVGHKVLQKLCLWFCATKDIPLYKGWKDLAAELHIGDKKPEAIEYRFTADPASKMLNVYVDREDATLIKILYALHVIGRNDIIFQLHPLVVEMCENINKQFKNSESNELIKPHQNPPPLPFILKDLDKRIDKESSKKKVRRYDKIVMLTYNSAEYDIAQKVASELRKEINGKQIGVIMLQDHESKVTADPETFITTCFAQANYILPILTVNYLNMLLNVETINSVLDNIDHNYAKYIYNLMTNNYTRRGCRNKKIRAIIPDEDMDDVQHHPLMNNPEFRAWVKLSEIEKFAVRILSSI